MAGVVRGMYAVSVLTLTLLQNQTAHAIEEQCPTQLFTMSEDDTGTFVVGSMTLCVEDGTKVLPVVHLQQM